MRTRKKIKGVFAAAVTGGHIYPALAVAQKMKEMVDLEAIFVGSGRGAEKRIYTDDFPFEHVTLPAVGSDRSKVSYLFHNSLAFVKILIILKYRKVDFVFTTGGYVGGITAYAAHLLKIPIFLHESNVKVGISNKLVTRYAEISFCTFESSVGKLKNAFVSGTPVRREFSLPKDPRFKEKYGSTVVLTFGGSEGSKTIDGITDFLSKKYPTFTFIHVGKEEIRRDNVKNFKYMKDIAYFMRNADFLIARAGASTIAEIMEVKIPSILIPWKGALNSHQKTNALNIAKSGAIIVVDEDDEKFNDKVLSSFKKMVHNASLMRKRMEEAFPKNQASFTVASKILEIIFS